MLVVSADGGLVVVCRRIMNEVVDFSSVFIGEALTSCGRKGAVMQSAIALKTTVQKGGRIEIADAQLLAGNIVDVIVLIPEKGVTPGHSITDALADTPGHLEFHTADDVEAYLREERGAWER